MATYAIGDVQGCYEELRALLNVIGFNPRRDQLWFTGDLVNRGPRSLEVIRFVRGLGEHAVSVLGNHDLHLLAVAHGNEPPGPRDTFGDILTATDRKELLEWLSQRPLLHHDPALGYTLIHAGLVPQWDLSDACALSAEAESLLRGPDAPAFFPHMYGDEPDRWDEKVAGWDRWRFITNVFTRLRYCDPDGRIHLRHKGPPGSQPAPLLPWFLVPGRRSEGTRIVFGHWSTLDVWRGGGVIGLDSGCLWGRRLSAVKLDKASDPQFFSVPCPRYQIPKGG
jgi:bis(5'-nucleosyl)-tetraphosphatase (symmetrical)